MSLVKEYCSEESLKKSGLFENLKVVRLINKLDKSDAASEFDEMALVGIISTQIMLTRFSWQGDFLRMKKAIYTLA